MADAWLFVMEALAALYEAYNEDENYCDEVNTLMESYDKWLDSKED